MRSSRWSLRSFQHSYRPTPHCTSVKGRFPESLFYRADFAPKRYDDVKGLQTARLELESGLLRWPNAAVLEVGLARVYLYGCRRAPSSVACDRVAGRTHLERALTIDPGLYDAAEALARLTVDEGNPAKGAAILEAFFAQPSERTPAPSRLSKLASLCEWTGRDDAARVALVRINQASLSDPWDLLTAHGIYEPFASLPSTPTSGITEGTRSF